MALDPALSACQLAQEILGNRAIVSSIEPLLCDRFHERELWKIATMRNTFLLRWSRTETSRATFARSFVGGALASQVKSGPQVFGYNEQQCAVLLQFIPAIPPPPYQRDALPYLVAMVHLRRFHEEARQRVDLTCETNPGNPVGTIVADLQAGTMLVPWQMLETSARIYGFFEAIRDLTARSATLIHGNLHRGNVLFSQFASGSWDAGMIDFDHSEWGIPHLDVEHFTIDLPPSQRHQLRCQYLDRGEIEPTQQRMFDLCQAAVLVQIAAKAFFCSRELAMRRSGFSANQMEAMLSAGIDPQDLTAPIDLSPETCQLRGLYALQRAIAVTQGWGPGMRQIDLL